MKRIILEGWLQMIEVSEDYEQEHYDSNWECTGHHTKTASISVLGLVSDDGKTEFPIIAHIQDLLGSVGKWSRRVKKNVTVRVHSADKKFTLEQGEQFLVETSMGDVSNLDYGHNFSDLTGYLWTDENFVVNNHDIGKFLYSLIGGRLEHYKHKLRPYVIIDIESHET